MGRVLAKSNGVGLKRHTDDVGKVFEELWRKIGSKIGDDIYDDVKVAIKYHDIGKVLPYFQIITVRNENYKPHDTIYHIPHNFVSILFMPDGINPDILLAVAYHHWRENFENIINKENIDLMKFARRLLEKDEFKEQLLDNLKNEMGDDFTLNDRVVRSLKEGMPLIRIIPQPLNRFIIQGEDIKKEKIRRKILISGLLQRCDHFASYVECKGKKLFEYVEIDAPNSDEVKEEIKKKIGDNAWQLKVLSELKSENLILIAPTGYGKTEFSFLWSSGDKTIYTLPIRSAVNQIFERAKSIFGKDKVGLLHSDADVFYLRDEENFASYELSRQISYPFIVSTGDQFFPYALKPPTFERIYALLSYSNLIIDEVQAYDPVAAAIIVKFIEDTVNMGGKFLLMTATLPEFVRNEIESRIGNEVEIKNIYDENDENKEGFRRFCKHRIKVVTYNPDGEMERVLEFAREGKRVLVIRNTVSDAQETYDRLKDSGIPVYLLHSRFTLEDRRNREEKIINEFKNPKSSEENQGKILVATQVVEASLDIDADVLFTDLCPLDALVQRMGRVMRRYFYRDGKVWDKSNDRELDEFNLCKEEPNVFVWVHVDKSKENKDKEKEVKLAKIKPYTNKLLLWSLAWLWRWGELKNSNDDINEDFIKENFYKPTKSKDFSRELLRFIEKEDIKFPMSEYDKYSIVKRFYETIEREGEYIKEFYETLEILDAGWVSERKMEAERIFRRIYEVKAVPKGRLRELKCDLDSFDFGSKRFAHFKDEVLSKYVINVPMNCVRNRVIDELEIEDTKLKRWLSDVFVVDYRYDEEKGIIRMRNEGCHDDNII